MKLYVYIEYMLDEKLELEYFLDSTSKGYLEEFLEEKKFIENRRITPDIC